MNKLSLYLSIFCIAVMLSCEKQSFPIYQQRAGAYFGSTKISYSFMQNPAEKTVTIEVPISISGDSMAYDRVVNVRIVTDSVTNAEEQMYEIQPAVIKAGQFSGVLPVVFHYDERMDTTEFAILFAIESSKEFPLINLNRWGSRIIVTNQVIKPENWDAALGYKFGTYSTRWWRFITEKTNMTSFPYWPMNPDKAKWWMKDAEITIYQSFIRLELAKYNAEHKDPLTHDDGPNAKQPVVMP